MSQVIAHRHLALLKVSSPEVLAEIRAVVPLDEYVIGQVSDTELILDPSRVGQLASAMADRNLPPMMKRAKTKK